MDERSGDLCTKGPYSSSNRDAEITSPAGEVWRYNS
jgi:hypothetical protein